MPAYTGTLRRAWSGSRRAQDFEEAITQVLCQQAVIHMAHNRVRTLLPVTVVF